MVPHQEFAAGLARDGFQEVVRVERAPNDSLDLHRHPFEAKALVLEGELAILTDGAEQVYKAGEIFHLAAYQPHSERYGPAGVTYLVGRKSS